MKFTNAETEGMPPHNWNDLFLIYASAYADFDEENKDFIVKDGEDGHCIFLEVFFYTIQKGFEYGHGEEASYPWHDAFINKIKLACCEGELTENEKKNHQEIINKNGLDIFSIKKKLKKEEMEFYPDYILFWHKIDQIK